MVEAPSLVVPHRGCADPAISDRSAAVCGARVLEHAGPVDLEAWSRNVGDMGAFVGGEGGSGSFSGRKSSRRPVVRLGRADRWTLGGRRPRWHAAV